MATKNENKKRGTAVAIIMMWALGMVTTKIVVMMNIV